MDTTSLQIVDADLVKEDLEGHKEGLASFKFVKGGEGKVKEKPAHDREPTTLAVEITILVQEKALLKDFKDEVAQSSGRE